MGRRYGTRTPASRSQQQERDTCHARAEQLCAAETAQMARIASLTEEDLGGDQLELLTSLGESSFYGTMVSMFMSLRALKMFVAFWSHYTYYRICT